CSEIEALGHLVRPGELLPRPCYEEAMNCFDETRNKKDLRSFLGFAGYHSRSIPHYREIAAPLTDLTDKKEFVFGQKEREAFEKLKELLASKPVLRDYDP